MSLRLSLQTNALGDPIRVTLTSDEGAGFLRSLPVHVRNVATFRKRSGDWGFPLDAYVISAILNSNLKVECTRALELYIEYLSAHQEEIRTAVQEPIIYHEFKDRLYPSQHNAVKFLEVVRKGILGFDMGTGKTVIASAAVNILNLSRVLVVCVDTVKWNWVEYMREWGDRSDTYVVEATWKGKPPRNIITGTTSQRTQKIDNLRTSGEPFILIMNYQQAQIHQEMIKNMDLDCLICDEAHRVTNRKVRTKNKEKTISRAVHEVAIRTPYVWLLTGTAIKNRHDDLFNLLRMCDHHRFGSYQSFISLYFNTILGFNGYEEPVSIRDLDYFNTMLGHYLLVRTVKEIYPEMPDKIYQDMYVKMTPEQAQVYNEMEQRFTVTIHDEIKQGILAPHLKIATNTVSQMMALRQITLTPALLGSKIHNSGKLEALTELFVELQETDEKVLVFTWFKSFIPHIVQILDSLSIPYGVISGDIPSQVRKDIETDLNSGKIRVVVGTLRSMSEGLNLQAARTAIFCDFDWVPAINKQAEARIHRGGADTSPTIIRLIHKDTIDEDILAVVAMKEQIVDETIGQVEILRRILERRGGK